MLQRLQKDNRRLVEIVHEQNDSIDALHGRLRGLETAGGRSHGKLSAMRKEAAACRSSLDWTTTRLGAAEGAMMRYVGKKLDLDPSILQSQDQLQVTREFWGEHGYDMSQGYPVIIRPNSNEVARGLVDSDSEDVTAWVARTPPSVISHEDQPVPYGFE